MQTEQQCEPKVFNSKVMSPEEEIEEAKNSRFFIFESTIYSQGRANEASIEFIKLQVQLASLLLGLVGIFWNVYSNSLPADTLPDHEIKRLFVLALFLLIGSIAIGLLYLKVVERYWDGITSNQSLRMAKWQEMIRKNTSFKEAIAFQEGTKLGTGHMVYTPEWPWIIQSVSLGLSMAIIFYLTVVLI